MNYQVTLSPNAKLDEAGNPTTKGSVEVIQRVEFVDAAKILLELARKHDVFIPEVTPQEVKPSVDEGVPFVIGGAGYDWTITLERCQSKSQEPN